MYLYSSGTTGIPKCSVRTVSQAWFEANTVAQTMETNQTDKILCALPLYHAYSMVHCMYASLVSGATLVLFKDSKLLKLSKEKLLQIIEKQQISIFPCIPFILSTLLESSRESDLSSLRVCYSGCSLLSKDLFDRFYEKFNIQVAQNYGSSEVSVLTINLDKDLEAQQGSLGKAFLGVDIKIIDEKNNEVPVGKEGEIIAKSRAMTKSYLKMSQVDLESYYNGYFRTGDIGYFTSTDHLYLTGRKKLVIEISGQKFNPIEVESVLLDCPSVQECVVIGVPSTTHSEQEVNAYVVLKKNCTQQSLQGFCAGRLPKFKTPQSIKEINEVPITATGKVIRQQSVLDTYLKALPLSPILVGTNK